MKSYYSVLTLAVWIAIINISCSKKGDPTPSQVSLTTTAVTGITLFSASGGGNITSEGGSPVTARGICWSTNAEPTIADSKTTDGAGTGSFISSITGLTTGTTYFVRAYATNNVGTVYGNAVSFATQTITDIDGNVYHAVTIGTQVWMVENLRVTKYNNGTTIPLITGNTVWATQSTAAYCWYNNDAVANKIPYGALYNWYAVVSGKLSPPGWHIPNDGDWSILMSYLSNSGPGKLKETGTGHWQSPNTGATNESGFTALPGGIRALDGSFNFMGHAGYWWDSSISGGGPAGNKGLLNSSGDTYFGNYQIEQMGYSVRCIKD